MSCWDGFPPPPWDEDDEGWHESDNEGEAWKSAGIADAEDWNPDSWRDGWRPTPEEELLRKELEQDEADGS